MGKSKAQEKPVPRRSQGVSPVALAEQIPPALPPSPSPETEFEPMTLRSSGATEYVLALAISLLFAPIDICATVCYRYHPAITQ